MIILLVIAAIIAGVMGEWIDTVAILAIVLLNGLLGFFQEARAEQALAALHRMTAPQARVLRNGTLHLLPSKQLVTGDVIELEAGDFVPADARLVRSFGLQTLEAALTGESTPSTKVCVDLLNENTALGDRRNMVFFGTTISAGKATALVTATGMRTELGHIAGLLQQTVQEQTPLQRRLEQLGRVLVVACLAIVAVIFVTQLLRGGSLVEVFLTSVSLAVAAIPEGLPAVVTITLAIGLQRMARRNAIIRRLPSVETLGCVTIICSDKTGTLTRNEMTVRKVWLPDREYEVTGEGYEPTGEFLTTGLKPSEGTNERNPVSAHQDADLAWLLQIASTCNNAHWSWSEQDRKVESFGDPTEIALLVAAEKYRPKETPGPMELVHESPFDSDRKMMSQVYRRSEHDYVMLAKGAPEVIRDRSLQLHRNGQLIPMHDHDIELIRHHSRRLADEALRVLAIAYRPATADKDDWQGEERLVFLGLLGLLDPPRHEVRDAVARCRSAGIKPVMITGDHHHTALAIARMLNIADADDEAMTGHQLNAIDDHQLGEQVERFKVFARVTAEHKLRVVNALRSRQQVVAMTGDGVNDAPAVKTADIGIVMGITGTDVAKEAADMVLTDDNFASIVNAVEEGRGIYENIQKFLSFLLSSNASEVIFMFSASLIGWPSPLLPVQILWINLVTDGIPAIALAMEPLEPQLMTRAPRPVSEPVLPARRIFSILFFGLALAITAGSLFGYALIVQERSLDVARTIAFCTLTCSQVFFSVGCRSFTKTMPELGLFSNPVLMYAVAGSIVLQVAVVSWSWTAHLLNVVPLGLSDWAIIISVSLIPVSLIEIGKLVIHATGLKR